jgi:hypothetical protein
MSRIDVAVASYALIYPICFFFTANVFPAYERFGLRWQALCVSALLSFSTLILERKSAGRYWDWLKQSPFSLVLPAGFLWLFVLGVVHGFTGDQMDGLVSGCFALIMMPLGFYCWPRSSMNLFSRAIGLSLVLGLVLENIFLSLYAFKGLSPNFTFLFALNMPRLFMNVRDGNALAVGASILAFQFLNAAPGSVFKFSKNTVFLSARSWMVGCMLMTAVFYNGFLTQGRGLFVSIFGGLLGVLLCSCMPLMKWIKIASATLISLASGWCLWALFNVLLAKQSTAAGLGFNGMVARESGGRFELWSAWWNSYVSKSLVFGHGLGIHPIEFLSDAASKNRTPHNLVFQLLTDSGLWGLLFGAVLVFIAWRQIRGLNLPLRQVCTYSIFSLGLYSTVAATLFWPTGVWICTLFPALLGRNDFLAEENGTSPDRGVGAWIFMILMLAFACFLQVLLVSGKQILMIPPQWLSAS